MTLSKSFIYKAFLSPPFTVYHSVIKYLWSKLWSPQMTDKTDKTDKTGDIPYRGMCSSPASLIGSQRAEQAAALVDPEDALDDIDAIVDAEDDLDEFDPAD